jgi:choline dehydrogenase-like flavoprotein
MDLGISVCDASVFPTSVGVNPQITVMAIASIIAARIIKDWDDKYSQRLKTNPQKEN